MAQRKVLKIVINTLIVNKFGNGFDIELTCKIDNCFGNNL